MILGVQLFWARLSMLPLLCATSVSAAASVPTGAAVLRGSFTPPQVQVSAATSSSPIPVPDSFVAKTAWPFSGGEPGFRWVADVDGDGKLDVLHSFYVFDGPTPALSYRTVLGSGDWIQGPSYYSSQLYPPGTVRTYKIRAAMDVDGDGKTDVLTTRYRFLPLPQGPDAPSLWRRNPQGGFVEDLAALPSSALDVRDAEFFDMDGDGDADLFLCTTSGCYAYLNDGTGHFSDASSSRLVQPSGLEGSRCAVLDADQDGDSDVLVLCGPQGHIGPTLLYVNQGSGYFVAVSQGVASSGLEVLTPDVDGDGLRDALAFYGDVVRMRLFLSRPGQSVLPQAPGLLPTLSIVPRETSLQVDFDLDGDDDIMIDGGTPLLLLENTGGQLIPSRAMAPAPGVRAVGDRLILDYDLDGDPDLLMGNAGSGALLLSNNYREARLVQSPTRGGMFQAGITAQGNHVVLSFLSWQAAHFEVPGIGLVLVDPGQSLASDGWAPHRVA